MNKLLYAVIFLLGAAAGSYITYQKMIEDEEERINAEVETALERLRCNEVKKESVKVSEMKEEERKHVKAENLAYAKVAKQYREFEEDAEKMNDADLNKHLAEREHPTDDEKEKTPVIYEITKEEYDESDFVGLTYTYFNEDDILLDEGDDVVDKPEELVGDMLSQFDDRQEVMYVRNNALGIDFEIIRRFSSYAEDILGVTEG